ncbi:MULTISPECIES: hypothetical protein [Serratia]|uniref:hypothetical protein n=1 Tax=Serratia TaxID=613 RepID=UPI000B2E7D09|nr:hypothetical protein [Serratia sp. 506_PEND]
MNNFPSEHQALLAKIDNAYENHANVAKLESHINKMIEQHGSAAFAVALSYWLSVQRNAIKCMKRKLGA